MSNPGPAALLAGTVVPLLCGDAVQERENAAQRMERVWLFHGTDEETVPKIASMGFNRSFCGKNATVYGKGGVSRAFKFEIWTPFGVWVMLKQYHGSSRCASAVYFARDAGYSARRQYAKANAEGIQHMFLVRVTIGEYCKGAPRGRQAGWWHALHVAGRASGMRT